MSSSFNSLPQGAQILWRRLIIRGRVQGVGFRPAVWRRATALGLAGRVWNTAHEVIIEVGGERDEVEEFESTLHAHLTPQAKIESMRSEEMPPGKWKPFIIDESEKADSAEPSISPDLATCADCQRELRDPNDRRFAYPFLACTQCGPRYTVIESMPYDREHTTLRHFPLCADCAREYHDSPADRRFHAEATACATCGPHMSRVEWVGGLLVESRSDQPINDTSNQLRQGGIVAVKGVGGYHLVCDATNAKAIATLRRRKGRPHKPLAVMMRNLNTVKRHCVVSEDEEAHLTSPEAPIVLLHKREDCSLPENLAPGNARLGVMLPYAPLHHLLMDDFEVLVMTSGNRSDEPLVTTEEELARLVPGIADSALAHNRPISNACDDSIAATLCEWPVILRRARGYVPTPIALPVASPVEMIALGSDLKNTFALVRGDRAYLAPHIGDLQSALNAKRARETAARWCDWLGIRPEVAIHDLHPQMVSTAMAKRWTNCERIAVQHHHAHLAACMAEHDVNEPTLGVIWDGTGFGPDHAVWGGEFLLATPDGEFERLAHLETVPLPGGDLAIRQPWRMAVGMLNGLLGGEAAREALEPMIPEWEVVFGQTSAWTEEPVASAIHQGFSREDFEWLMSRLETHPDQFAATSSAGRLFDVVGVLCGLGPAVSFEGQHAIALEAMATERTEPWPVEIDRSATPWKIRISPILRGLLSAKLSASQLSSQFHSTLCAIITEVACTLSKERGKIPVALSGGCFQNATLLRGVVSGLRARGIEPLHHRCVPPNDGGVAFGQAVVAAQRLAKR